MDWDLIAVVLMLACLIDQTLPFDLHKPASHYFLRYLLLLVFDCVLYHAMKYFDIKKAFLEALKSIGLNAAKSQAFSLLSSSMRDYVSETTSSLSVLSNFQIFRPETDEECFKNVGKYDLYKGFTSFEKKMWNALDDKPILIDIDNQSLIQKIKLDTNYNINSDQRSIYLEKKLKNLALPSNKTIGFHKMMTRCDSLLNFHSKFCNYNGDYILSTLSYYSTMSGFYYLDYNYGDFITPLIITELYKSKKFARYHSYRLITNVIQEIFTECMTMTEEDDKTTFKFNLDNFNPNNNNNNNSQNKKYIINVTINLTFQKIDFDSPQNYPNCIQLVNDDKDEDINDHNKNSIDQKESIKNYASKLAENNNPVFDFLIATPVDLNKIKNKITINYSVNGLKSFNDVIKNSFPIIQSNILNKIDTTMLIDPRIFQSKPKADCFSLYKSASNIEPFKMLSYFTLRKKLDLKTNVYKVICDNYQSIFNLSKPIITHEKNQDLIPINSMDCWFDLKVYYNISQNIQINPLFYKNYKSILNYISLFTEHIKNNYQKFNNYELDLIHEDLGGYSWLSCFSKHYFKPHLFLCKHKIPKSQLYQLILGMTSRLNLKDTKELCNRNVYIVDNRIIYNLRSSSDVLCVPVLENDGLIG
ncbi:uncharacterized protein ASCRUDRAFT_74106 [Ascoidea rubescens DSM 1968]|uniref:Uncharacterized protein n=1 Tax=Ascoidea rubescens DSM 1968 TaxID=1344418 RepID=A0A1D2VSA6_9ASCO|nr:hypothetical protein ASCRUDRAFT_74106 [Ascoidea rubescens DSM 1968]ODV64494.1 hypothetical protein ASCRUDRAFT_74106 [Ascoidea rubescens DSM 1968]